MPNFIVSLCRQLMVEFDAIEFAKNWDREFPRFCLNERDFDVNVSLKLQISARYAVDFAQTSILKLCDLLISSNPAKKTPIRCCFNSLHNCLRKRRSAIFATFQESLDWFMQNHTDISVRLIDSSCQF
jgi:hypothetical protein